MPGCRRRFASARRVRVHTTYEPQYPNPICVAAGESVRVGREDADFPGWKWCRAADGREGWVPVELLSNDEAGPVVLEDYSARELAVGAGEEVTVEDARHGWLQVRDSRGERGWIPASHVSPA
jgi:SH3-like domain-containing protein